MTFDCTEEKYIVQLDLSHEYFQSIGQSIYLSRNAADTGLDSKGGKAFSTSLHLWFCIQIPITVSILNLVQNTGNPAIVLVVQINNMIAHFTVLFVLIVLGKFVQTWCSLKYGKQGHREFPFGNRGPPKFPAGIPGIYEITAGITRNL